VRVVFSKEGIRFLHREAHGCLDLVFEHAAALPFSVVAQEMTGVSHGSLRNQMVHVLYTEAGWVGDLQGKPVAKWRNEDFRDVRSLAEAKRSVAGETAEYLESLAEAELNAQLTRRPKEWVGPLRSPGFILLHIVTHAFHHKGQMAMMLRMLGHPIGDTDLQRED
jgi:uncharacterized damage-inducible protein DinB